MNPVAYICQNRRQGIPVLLLPQTKAYQSYIILYENGLRELIYLGCVSW